MVLIRKFASKVDRFLAHHLDSEAVTLFQVIVYLHMAGAALYGLFVAGGIPPGLSAAVPRDDNAVETAWLILLMLGVLAVIGRGLVASRYAGNRASIYTCGAWLQFTGDLSMAWGFAWYVLASWGNSYWGKESIAAFGFAAYAWCAFFLVIRDIRRIMQAERAVRG
ncbi:hypothetical protein SEA_RYADEL_75 [Mycobacterium phage Ryadel]|uniref:Uncharacterized protein n=1 Tax=Mycobacterium phage Ryadel TaxID=2283292 RepID=A0A345MF43_9CAUD|nr:membrane protein [Mycobacterium phage Ryadel]AXH69174.1 hypothetical protein SEA_RYADEL_75 [Mycobacterium phage Ryadel]QGJ87393.1 membrane protein [Mycobacterium phage Blessica]